MPSAIEFTLSDGTAVRVAPTARKGTGPVGVGPTLESASRTLREALAPIGAAATDMIDELRSAAHRPDEVEVTFGVALDGKLGAVIASANAGAHLDVTLRWHGATAADGDGSP